MIDWISIKDRLPENSDKLYLIWSEATKYPLIWTGREINRSIQQSEPLPKWPTEWAEINPPKEKK